MTRRLEVCTIPRRLDKRGNRHDRHLQIDDVGGGGRRSDASVACRRLAPNARPLAPATWQRAGRARCLVDRRLHPRCRPGRERRAAQRRRRDRAWRHDLRSPSAIGTGRFELRTLLPGAYLVRAHLSGFLASRGKTIDVRPSSRASSSIAMRRAFDGPGPGSTTLGAPSRRARGDAGRARRGRRTSGRGDRAASVPPNAPAGTDAATSQAPANDDHSEPAWRLRHRVGAFCKSHRMAVLDVADRRPADTAMFGATTAANRSPAQLAANLFSGTPFSGQLNLLTTSSFDDPQQLFNSDIFARSVAYISVGAPAGSHADWAVRGALSQADISVVGARRHLLDPRPAPATTTTSVSRTPRSATMAAIRRRCATSPTAAGTPARCTGSTPSPFRRRSRHLRRPLRALRLSRCRA